MLKTISTMIFSFFVLSALVQDGSNQFGVLSMHGTLNLQKASQEAALPGQCRSYKISNKVSPVQKHKCRFS